MAGTTRVTDKPIIGSLQEADYLLCIADGEVKRAEPGSIGEISITDADSGQKYDCKLIIRNGHLVLLNVSEQTIDFTLPIGRMRGDANGDGVINESDYTVIDNYVRNIDRDVDNVAIWCMDLNIDGSVNVTDTQQMSRYLAGLTCALTGIPTFADYYGNWAYVKVDDTTGYWAYNVNIDMDDFEVVRVYGFENITEYSVSGQTLTIKVSAPPISAVAAHVVVKAAEPENQSAGS